MGNSSAEADFNRSKGGKGNAGTIGLLNLQSIFEQNPEPPGASAPSDRFFSSQTQRFDEPQKHSFQSAGQQCQDEPSHEKRQGTRTSKQYPFSFQAIIVRRPRWLFEYRLIILLKTFWMHKERPAPFGQNSQRNVAFHYVVTS
jgi:hypothetical protein